MNLTDGFWDNSGTPLLIKLGHRNHKNLFLSCDLSAHVSPRVVVQGLIYHLGFLEWPSIEQSSGNGQSKKWKWPWNNLELVADVRAIIYRRAYLHWDIDLNLAF